MPIHGETQPERQDASVRPGWQDPLVREFEQQWLDLEAQMDGLPYPSELWDQVAERRLRLAQSLEASLPPMQVVSACQSVILSALTEAEASVIYPCRDRAVRRLIGEGTMPTEIAQVTGIGEDEVLRLLQEPAE